MFMGPWDQGGPWSPTGIAGVSKFLHRVWAIATDPHGTEPGDKSSGELPAGESEHQARDRMRAAAHRTLRDVTEDFEGFRWNTMVAKLMELTQRPVPLPRAPRSPGCPSGTRPSACCC